MYRRQSQWKKKLRSRLVSGINERFLAIHISFNAKIMQYALENWPAQSEEYRRNGETGPYHYIASVYEKLGL